MWNIIVIHQHSRKTCVEDDLRLLFTDCVSAMDTPSQFNVMPATDNPSPSMATPCTLSESRGFNAEGYRSSYDSVVNKAVPMVESSSIMISNLAQGTRQTCDNIPSKGKNVLVVAPVDNVPLDGAKSAQVLMPDISSETNRRDENLKSKGQNTVDMAPVNTVPYDDPPVMHALLSPRPTQDGRKHMDSDNPAMLFFPSHPTKQEWANIAAANKSGLALTGSAAMGQVGPIVGLMDVGECEDSYLFRVALPGVKRDKSEFNCGIDDSGKVSIHGITMTGEKSVHKFSQVFEMKTQNLCPSGHFSLSFQLPGRVVAEEFSGNFGTDGILEGIVKKEKCTTPPS